MRPPHIAGTIREARATASRGSAAKLARATVARSTTGPPQVSRNVSGKRAAGTATTCALARRPAREMPRLAADIIAQATSAALMPQRARAPTSRCRGPSVIPPSPLQTRCRRACLGFRRVGRRRAPGSCQESARPRQSGRRGRAATLLAMDLGIRGRTAMISAGSKGLGRATAIALAREGARVAIGARSAAALDEAAAGVGAAGGEALAMSVDVGRADDLERWHRATVDRFGAPTLVLTNTGGPPAGQFEDLAEDAWRAGIEGTLMNVVRLCRLVLPAMRAAKYGRIVHLTSFVAKQPMALLTISS